MNKQEVINYTLKEIKTHQKDNSFQRGYRTAMSRVHDRVKQLDEPEKVVVPQYIDTWIQGAKYNGLDLYEAMLDNGLLDEANMWIEYNSETFAKAWIYGYEVEKEKKYTVELPNPNGESNIYGLCKVDNRIIIGTFVFGLNKASNTKLTEAEIKEDFGWAWQFAEEVEE